LASLRLIAAVCGISESITASSASLVPGTAASASPIGEAGAIFLKDEGN